MIIIIMVVGRGWSKLWTIINLYKEYPPGPGPGPDDGEDKKIIFSTGGE
jgi:hypothetical protein